MATPCDYRETSSISRTISQSINVSCILLKPGVKLRMKMLLEQRRYLSFINGLDHLIYFENTSSQSYWDMDADERGYLP